MRLKEWLNLAETAHTGAAYALHKNLHPRVGHLEHAHDLHHGAYRIQVVRAGVFGAFFFLGADEQMASVLESGVHCLNRFFTPDEEGQNHVVKYNHVAHGQNRQGVGYALHGGGQTAFALGHILRERVGVPLFFVFNVRARSGTGSVQVQQMVLVIVISHILSLTALYGLHLRDAVAVSLSNDNVIQKAQAQLRCKSLQFGGKSFVRLGRRGVAAGMVVHHYDAAGLAQQRGLEYFSGLH